MKFDKILSAVLLMAVFTLIFISEARCEEEKIIPEKDIQEHRIIRLQRLGEIYPPEITIAPGTTVVWINNARSAVEIKFVGKQVTLACKSPVHFIVHEDGSYVSNKIQQGSVASLCMIEKGEYNYVARQVLLWGEQNRILDARVKEFRGKITVK